MTAGEEDQLCVRSPWRVPALVTSVLPVAIGGIVFAPIAPAMFAAFALLCLLIAVAYWRMELRCDERGVVVCNGFRTRHIAWPDVADISWRRRWPWGPAVVLELRDGRSVPLTVTYEPFAPENEGRGWVERVRRCQPTSWSVCA